MPNRWFFLPALALVLFACAGSVLHLNLQLDSPGGLEAGDPVLLSDKPVGEVESVEPGAERGYVAKLAIAPVFREEATEDARFVVAARPDDADRRCVKLLPGKGGAPLLVDGATVQGSVDGDSLLGGILRSLSDTLGTLRDQVDHFRSEIQRLPQSAEVQRLQKEWERLAQEMKQAQSTAEDTVKKDLIPKIQKELDDLEQQLRGLQPEPQPGGKEQTI